MATNTELRTEAIILLTRMILQATRNEQAETSKPMRSPNEAAVYIRQQGVVIASLRDIRESLENLELP